MGSDLVLDLKGTITLANGDSPLTVDVRGFGRANTGTDGWEYDNWAPRKIDFVANRGLSWSERLRIGTRTNRNHSTTILWRAIGSGYFSRCPFTASMHFIGRPVSIKFNRWSDRSCVPSRMTAAPPASRHPS
jgi:hypothetical protein